MSDEKQTFAAEPRHFFDMKKKTITEKYETFCRLMYEDKLFLVPEISFYDICKIIGARPCILNSKLRDELGLDGRAIIRKFREDYYSSLNMKHSGGLRLL